MGVQGVLIGMQLTGFCNVTLLCIDQFSPKKGVLKDSSFKGKVGYFV